MRVLIAGVGNVLRGDDGFGVEVLRRLEQELSGAAGVRFFESGIAGIGLVQQLLDGFDALIVLDALDRGAEPGTVFVLEPDVKRGVASGRTDEGVDLHQTDPEGVFAYRNSCGGGILPLHLGTLAGGEIHCPWHGCRYDVRTGKRIDGAGADLDAFQVAVRDGLIHVAARLSE